MVYSSRQVQSFFYEHSIGRLVRRPLFLMIIIYLMGATIYRNADWRSARALYTHDTALETRSFVLWNNLGVMHFREGETSQAVDAFLRSLESVPEGKGYSVAYNNLGAAFEYQGNVEAAMSYYEAGIAHSRYRLSFVNLAKLYIQKKELRVALDVVLDGLISYPFDYELNYLASYLYAVQAQIDEAKFHLNRIPPTYQRADFLRKKLGEFPE